MRRACRSYSVARIGSFQVRAADRGWVSRSTVQNQPFMQSLAKRFDASTTLEPFKDFRIVVQANLKRSDNYQEFYRPDSTGAIRQPESVAERAVQHVVPVVQNGIYEAEKR